MIDIRVEQELWATRLAPEGLIERWCAPDGGAVACGEPVAQVRIEDRVFSITAPSAGILHHLACEGGVVEPDLVIAQLE